VPVFVYNGKRTRTQQMQMSGGHLLAAGWTAATLYVSPTEKRQSSPVARTTSEQAPNGVPVFLTAKKDSNPANADVRRTSACCRPDGGNSLRFSNGETAVESCCPHPVGASFVSLAPTFFKSQSALTPLLLLFSRDPLALGSRLMMRTVRIRIA